MLAKKIFSLLELIGIFLYSIKLYLLIVLLHSRELNPELESRVESIKSAKKDNCICINLQPFGMFMLYDIYNLSPKDKLIIILS